MADASLAMEPCRRSREEGAAQRSAHQASSALLRRNDAAQRVPPGKNDAAMVDLRLERGEKLFFEDEDKAKAEVMVL